MSDKLQFHIWEASSRGGGGGGGLVSARRSRINNIRAMPARARYDRAGVLLAPYVSRFGNRGEYRARRRRGGTHFDRGYSAHDRGMRAVTR